MQLSKLKVHTTNRLTSKLTKFDDYSSNVKLRRHRFKVIELTCLGMNILVSKFDLEKINTLFILMSGDESKYLAGLSVYHELHCLVKSPTFFPSAQMHMMIMV